MEFEQINEQQKTLKTYMNHWNVKCSAAETFIRINNVRQKRKMFEMRTFVSVEPIVIVQSTDILCIDMIVINTKELRSWRCNNDDTQQFIQIPIDTFLVTQQTFRIRQKYKQIQTMSMFTAYHLETTRTKSKRLSTNQRRKRIKRKSVLLRPKRSPVHRSISMNL